MSNQETIVRFLDENYNTAMSKRVIQQNLNICNIERKLKQLVKMRFIRVKAGIVDYPTKRNKKVMFYYRGEPLAYVPRPKTLL